MRAEERARRRNAVAGLLAATAAATTAFAITSRGSSAQGQRGAAHSVANDAGATVTTNTNVPIEGVQLPPGVPMMEPVQTQPEPQVQEPSTQRTSGSRTIHRSRRPR
jgi:hypothetical protein